jgi:hypothetical protein
MLFGVNDVGAVASQKLRQAGDESAAVGAGDDQSGK